MKDKYDLGVTWVALRYLKTERQDTQYPRLNFEDFDKPQRIPQTNDITTGPSCSYSALQRMNHYLNLLVYALDYDLANALDSAIDTCITRRAGLSFRPEFQFNKIGFLRFGKTQAA